MPFHEWPATQDTRLEYQQQGNVSNWKIHFFNYRGQGNFFGKKNMFWVSCNYRSANEILAELIWDKKGGMIHPNHSPLWLVWNQHLVHICSPLLEISALPFPSYWNTLFFFSRIRHVTRSVTQSLCLSVCQEDVCMELCKGIQDNTIQYNTR